MADKQQPGEGAVEIRDRRRGRGRKKREEEGGR
jgi:hypothetical protein